MPHVTRGIRLSFLSLALALRIVFASRRTVSETTAAQLGYMRVPTVLLPRCGHRSFLWEVLCLCERDQIGPREPEDLSSVRSHQ